MKKNLKTKVILSVFAGTMMFGGTALGAEIVIDGTDIDTTQDKWYEAFELKDTESSIFGDKYGIIPKNATNTVVLNNINYSADDKMFTNVTMVDSCQLGSTWIMGGFAEEGKGTAGMVSDNMITVTNTYGSVVLGSSSNEYSVENNIVYANKFNGISVYGGYNYGATGETNKNKVYLKNSNVASVYGGYSYDGDSNGNVVYLDNVIAKNGEIYGGFSEDNGSANYNKIIIQNGSNIEDVVGGAASNIECINNSITIVGDNNLKEAVLLAYSGTEETYRSGNILNLDGFNGEIKSVHNFDIINFENLDFNKEKTLTVSYVENMQNTAIRIGSIVVGENIKIGDNVDLLKVEGEDSDSYDDNFLNIKDGYQTVSNAGVASIVTSDITKNDEEKTITATIAKIERNKQTNLVAESRAVAAAFVNQGTDLIADSLDTLSRDGKYGVKTFAAVHGNRSKYDVNSDIKINGWSTIVGVGAENEHNGGDFSWGVFYENGSGNYRTYNDFNNEFFRGDGSLVYNGGGIAARYENSHGVYTEGSLRAGMLKSEMTDALSDGENKYGYESETAYYGAHIGVGKIFSLGDDSDLDVYGKFFHTYTEGDSFNVAGDEFEFDSINSDRLRIGARVTSNKENKFSTYYGLAYEYEFNGDAEMRAAGMKAPTQSLQGSSVMAEIGLNYQPTPDSPWSFDLNMRGYAGERQGGSFNVQATYTF